MRPLEGQPCSTHPSTVSAPVSPPRKEPGARRWPVWFPWARRGRAGTDPPAAGQRLRGGVPDAQGRDWAGNIVVWPQVFERFRQTVMTASLLRVDGRVQREGQVVHLIADRLTDLTATLHTLTTPDAAAIELRSRDFH